MLALGDVDAAGVPAQHYRIRRLSLATSTSDIDAPVADGVPVLNPAAAAPPPPPAGPPAPPVSPLPPNGACTAPNGTAYQACTTTSDAGAVMTIYQSRAGKTLSVTLK
jgi:hypothetical protein